MSAGATRARGESAQPVTGAPVRNRPGNAHARNAFSSVRFRPGAQVCKNCEKV